jgi:hypothetical protein
MFRNGRRGKLADLFRPGALVVTNAAVVGVVLLVLQLLPGTRVAAQGSDVLVDFDRLSPRELRSAGFVLARPTELQITATGAEQRGRKRFQLGPIKFDTDDWSDGDYWQGNAWILDARTRAVVWDLSRAKTEARREGLRDFDGRVQLPAGTYEAYFASFSGTQRPSLVGLVSGQRRMRYDDDGLSESFQLTIRGNGQRIAAADLARARAEFNGSVVVSVPGGRREQTARLGFSLERPTDVEIYAVGEAQEESAFDYGWIINADTRERIWRFDDIHSEPAGGASKNRTARVVRTLPAGRYAAFFAMDDSHDPSEWNAAPPYDPAFWGLTVRVRNPADRGAVRTYAYQSGPGPNAIVALTGLRDDASRSYGFTLTKPTDVRIYALGEGRAGEMFDYGWITDADTHERVWEMRYHETENAGGAEKNRVVDKVVHLEKGSYLVNFVTDDSHSYGDWNAAAPMDGEFWGITLLPAAPASFDRSAIAPYDPKTDPNLIARLERMRDGQERRVRFRLDNAADVRVYGVGEGRDGEMFDYGWIEDASTGRTAWEMDYRATEHAGGATKNRRVNQTVRLPAGDYVLRYRTDDSHAFNDWNDEPPSDASGWGISVFRK